MAETILQIAAVLVFFAILFTMIRLIIGRTLVDRIVAVDMLTVISISLIALYALVYGLLSFLAVLAIARFLERGL